MPKRPNIQAIEFLKGRIYLGAYDSTPQDTKDLVYFTVEDSLPYNAFHLDFGPLHIGHLYRFAVVLHNILNDDSNHGKAIVFYSSTGTKERANAACLLCCYMILIQSWAPHQVLQPISQCDHPFMPFRDAGYSNADFELTIQDIIYGVWRAKERNMIDLTNFNLEEYEQYERVDQGDFNVISKDFIAFASPQQSRPGAPLNEPFKKVLTFFQENDVQLVVRLNSHLYDANEFTQRNIRHIDMIFDDGTCPTMEYVQKFIGAAETVINEGGKIAVHCKAGLGRTGCLIGAHLIYTHGFTANECIAYMRMIRPGMVVGPQQHWLYLHQNEFRNWRHTMVLDNIPDSFIGDLYPLVSYESFKQRNKKKKMKSISNSSSFMNNESSFATPVRRRISGQLVAVHNAVPITSPGQPRKNSPKRDTANASSDHYAANNSDREEYEEQQLSSPRKSIGSQNQQENFTNSDEEVDRYIEDDEEVVYIDSSELNSSPKRLSSERRKIVRSTPTSGGKKVPLSLTRTTTKTTTTTTTMVSSSPPQSSNILPKARNRVVSSSKMRTKLLTNAANDKVIGNGGIRKMSQSKRNV